MGEAQQGMLRHMGPEVQCTARCKNRQILVIGFYNVKENKKANTLQRMLMRSHCHIKYITWNKTYIYCRIHNPLPWYLR